MSRRWNPLGLVLALVLTATAALAADRPAKVEKTSPVAAQSDPEATTAEGTEVPVEASAAAEPVPAVEPDACDSATSPSTLSTDDAVSAADADEGSRTCKEYGQICRKTRQCCAPLHCAFDGYTFYCRY
jgi:hypothetical protein